MTRKEDKLTFKAQELALWYDRDERDSDWNKILSSTKKSLFSVIDCTLCVTPYHSESYLGFGGFITTFPDMLRNINEQLMYLYIIKGTRYVAYLFYFVKS